MLELLILGLLFHEPLYGYSLKKRVDQIAVFQRTLSWGTIYPLLLPLEKQGLLTSHKTLGKRPHITYALTNAGKKRFIELICSPAETIKPIRETFRYKVIFFTLITSEQRKKILTEYIQTITQIAVKVKEMVQKNSEKKKAQYIFAVTLHAIDEFNAEIAWARSLLQNE